MTGNINRTSPDWTNPISASDFASATGKTLAAVRNVKGTPSAASYFYMQALATDNTLYVGMTANGGDTWTFTSVGVVSDTTVPLGFDVSKHDPLKVWSAGADGVLNFSDDGAASFSMPFILSDAAKPIAAIEVPYEDNPNDQTIYISVDVTGHIPLIVIRTTQGIFWSRTVGDVSPTWTPANNGLTTPQKTSIRSIALDTKGTGPPGGIITPTLYMTCSEGLFRNEYLTSDGVWEQMKTNADAITMINAAGGSCTPLTNPGGWYTIATSSRPVGSLIQVIAGGDSNVPNCQGHKRVFYSTDALTTVTIGDDFLHPITHPTHTAIKNGQSISTYDWVTCYSYNCGWGVGQDPHVSHSFDGGATILDSGGLSGAAFDHERAYHTRSGHYLLFGRFGKSDLHKSTDGGESTEAGGNMGAALANATGRETDRQALMLHPNDINSALAACDVLRKTANAMGGSGWGATPSNVSQVECITPVPGHRDKWLVGRATSPIQAKNFIYYTKDFTTSWSNKTGDLGDYHSAGDDVLQMVYSTAFDAFGAGTDQAALLKSIDGFGTYSGVTPAEGGMTGLESIKTDVLDKQAVTVLVREYNTEEHHTVVSGDGADVWTEKSDFTELPGVVALRCRHDVCTAIP
jgi:hypothetical protein